MAVHVGCVVGSAVRAYDDATHVSGMMPSARLFVTSWRIVGRGDDGKKAAATASRCRPHW